MDRDRASEDTDLGLLEMDPSSLDPVSDRESAVLDAIAARVGLLVVVDDGRGVAEARESRPKKANF